MNKRPWLRMENRFGTRLIRCKDPAKAAPYLVVLKYSSGWEEYPYATAAKLTIGDVEYNPPLRTYTVKGRLHPVFWEIPEDIVKAAQKDLEYLIDMHMAFYG